MSELDRKNILWEGSRMFLPEHRQQLQNARKQRQTQPPEWAPDLVEEFNRLIQDALYHESPVLLTYLQDQQLHSFCGFIEKMDQQQGWLLIVNGQHKQKVRFTHLYDISSP